MGENYKNNLIETSKDRNKIRKYFSKLGIYQNLDVLKGLSREERISKQKERIEEIIKEEENPIEKKRLTNLLNSFLSANESIGDFLKEHGKKIDEKTGEEGKTRIRKAFKQSKKENEIIKSEKTEETFEEDERKAFIHFRKVLKDIDKIELSINKAHLEIVDGLPGSEEYFDDLLKEKVKAEKDINKLEEKDYLALRSAKLLSLHNDLEKEGHIARVDSTKKDISFINEALLTGNPVFLHGPTGTGKTSIARFAAKELTGYKPHMIYCNPQTKESNIFGRQSIDVEGGASKTYFDLGPLAKAMDQGKVCIFDEFSSLPKEQMSMIKGLLNHKVGDEVDIPGNGFVRIKQGFQIIYTANLKSDKNKERNDLPPEVANESAILNKEIKYQSPIEGYDIFLSRIMNDEGVANFSKFDLENTIPSFLKGCKDIQDAYQGISSREFVESLGVQDSGSSKVTSLKKFVLNQRSISQILNIWSVRSKRDKSLSFMEFLDESLVNALNFGEYKEDKLLATKILVNRGLLGTVNARDLGLEEDDLSVGSRNVEKENLGRNKNLSKEVINLNIKELAQLDPFELRQKKINVDISSGFVDGEGKKVEGKEEATPERKTVPIDLNKIDKALEKLGSPARIDTSIEGGSINISLDSNDMKYLTTIDKALEKFKSADTTTDFVSETFRKLPWDQIKNKNINAVIINHGETTPTQRDQMVLDMDKLGWRPATVAELTALAIKRVDLFKKYPDPIFNSYMKYTIDFGLRAPFFDWFDVERRPGTFDASDDWSGHLRFVFVRK